MLQFLDLKGAFWSFGEEIQTKKLDIYSTNEVIIQTLFHFS